MKVVLTVRRTAVAVVAATALASTGCGSASDDATSLASADAGVSTDEEATDSGESWSAVVGFSQAVADGDWARAAELSAPDSAAAAYVQYREDVARAQESIGADPAEPLSVTPDSSSGTVTVALSDDVEYMWSAFDVEGGQVSDFTTDRGRMSDLVILPSGEEQAAGATVGLSSAYATSSGDLYVVVRIAADTTILVDEELTLQTPDGGSVPSEERVGVDEVVGGTTGVIVYTFAGQPLGGTVVYEVQNDTDAPAAVRLPVGTGDGQD